MQKLAQRSALASFVLFCASLAWSIAASAASSGDCSNESPNPGLVFCEPFESDSWYHDHDWVDAAWGAIDGAPYDELEGSTLVSSTDEGVACVQGRCLRNAIPAGSHGRMALKWLIEDNADPALIAANGNEEMYLSYYIFLSDDWNPNLSSGSNGGKFPGLGDERIFSSSVGQCGNGGDFADGINCWTGRASWYSCDDGGDACTANPNATTKIGIYIYVKDANQLPGHYDDDQTVRFGSCSSVSGVTCGIGSRGMLENGRWYHYEQYFKMNTPGVPDGVMRGWIDGVLSYEKTNTLFRDVGHDDLQIKTVWLDIFAGGSGSMVNNSEVYIDELVLSTTGPISGQGQGTVPKPPVVQP